MLNRNFANSTANIGLAAAQKAVLPQNQPNLADVVANGVLGYKAAKVAEDEQMKRQAYVDALASGNQDAVNQAWAQYDPDAYAARQAQLADQEQARQWDLEDMARKEQFERELAAIRHRNAMETAAARGGEGTNAFGSKNEFINLLGIKNDQEIWSSLPEDDKKRIEARLNYMANNPNNIYETSYQRTAGSEAAKQQAQDVQNAIQSQQQQQNLSEAINLVTNSPDKLFRPDAAISSMIGVYGGNIGVGMSPEEQTLYGDIERTIGSIENDLIAKARSKGQTGINTIAEIRQAAKGLQLGRGKQRLIGALQAMKRIEERLDKMPTTMSMMPTNNNLQVGQKIGGFTVVGVE